MSDELAPNSLLCGRYRLIRKLGEGGMGLVWAAAHTVTGKQVALKLLKPETAADPRVRQRFLREARAACAVRHPSIVEIHDVLEDEIGTPIMVMDLLEGQTLGERLGAQRALPLIDLARIMLPVVSAVGAAHAAGIVHRDLKPDNIFLVNEVDGTSAVKVLDFGIAKINAVEGIARPETGALTGTGAMMGTPYYMAPEQIFGEKDVDHRADIWALGVIFYECLAGQRPTQAENMGQIIKIVTTDGIVPLEQVAPQVPRDITDLVRRMLSRNRNDRPQSLSEVLVALRRHVDLAVQSFAEPAISARLRNSGSGRPPTDRSLANSPNAAVFARTAMLTTGSSTSDLGVAPSSRSRAPLVLGAALVLALGIAGGLAMRSRGDPTGHAVPLTSTAAASTAAPVASPVAVTTTAPAASSTSASATPSISAPPTTPAPAVAKTVHAPPPTASAPPPPQPSKTAAAPPGGIVEKPPF